MLLLIAALVFVSVALFAFEMLRARPVSLRGRVAGAERAADDLLETSRTDGTLARRVISPAAGRLGRSVERLLPANWLHTVRALLEAADDPWTLTGFLAMWAVSAGIGAALWVYVGLSASLSGLQLAVVGMAIMPLAILLPYGRVRSKARARQRSIVRALPDAMDLLVTSVEAGMGIDAAFAMVTDKTEGPLSDSFSQYLKQIGLGRSRREALTQVAERTGVGDLVEIANNINQGEQLGTPVADVLRAQADNLRALRRERAQLKAQRAPVLMTIPLALCFLPAMGAVVIVPAVLNLVQFVGNLGG